MIDNSYITFQLFEQFEDLICAFSTRRGGHSTGIFSSLNMGNTKHDNITTVMKNRQLFYNKLGILENAVALPDQIHSSNIQMVFSAGIIPQSDALITSNQGLFLGVQTADCFPVFLYSPHKKIIGIVHAGWRGAVQNILLKTIDFLTKDLDLSSSELYVVIGPGLQKECFEVKSDVFNQFPETFLGIHQDTEKKYLDLSGYLYQQLLSTKIPVEQIYRASDCTKCNWKEYYSYRRDGNNSGRMLGIIGIKP